MSDFNAIQFGDNIKKYRKQKGLSQENIARRLNTTGATISRFESGEMIPNAKEIHDLCDELGIYESDLFERNFNVSNKEDVKNPFGTDTLYMLFNAYTSKTEEFYKHKYILKFREKVDRIEVDQIDYKDGTIYSTGYMLADSSNAFISMNNHKPNMNRLDVCEIVICVSRGVEDLMLGAYFGNSLQHEPSLRKCIFSKKDIDFTDDLLEILKPKEKELRKLEENYALYLDIINK